MSCQMPKIDNLSIQTYLALMQSRKLNHLSNHGRFESFRTQFGDQMEKLSLVSCKELARRLKTEIDTVNNLRRRNSTFPHYKVLGSRYMYPLERVKKWVKKNGALKKAAK